MIPLPDKRSILGAGNNYGVMMDGVMVDSSYTVTFYVSQQESGRSIPRFVQLDSPNNVIIG